MGLTASSPGTVEYTIDQSLTLPDGTVVTRSQTFSIECVAEDVEIAMLAPSPQWDGTPGNGFGGSNPAAPTPTNLATQAANTATLNHLFKDLYTFTDDYLLAFHADAKFGIEKVRVWCEGNYVDISSRVETTYTNAKGTQSPLPPAYLVKLDYDAIMAISQTGTVRVYAETFTNDPTNQPNRIIGPFTLHAREAGVGPGKQFDISLDIDPLAGSDVAGVSYRKIADALQYCAANIFLRPRLRLTRAYVNGDLTTTYEGFMVKGTLAVRRDYATTLATIEPADGVTARIGNWAITQTGSLGYDGVYIRNTPLGNIQLDLAGMGTGTATSVQGGVFRGHTQSYNVFFLEGVEAFDGTPPASLTSYAGSGSTLRKFGYERTQYWVTRQNIASGAPPLRFVAIDCNVHDINGYGLSFGELFLNNTLRNCSGSGMEECTGAVIGNRVSRIGGVHNGDRQHKPWFTITPPNDGSVYEFEKKGGNARGKDKDFINNGGTAQYDEGIDTPVNGIYLYKDGVQTHYFPLDGSGTSTTDMGDDAVAYLQSAGMTVTNFNAAITLAATFMSMADLVPSAAIPRRIIPAEGLNITAIADIHSNAIVCNSTKTNLAVACNVVYEINGAAPLAFRQAMFSTSVHHNVFHTSVPEEGGGTNQAFEIRGGPGGTPFASILLYANTIMGVGQSGNLSSDLKATAQSRFDHNYWAWSPGQATTDANVVQRWSAARVGPFAASAQNCDTLGSVVESTLFANITSAGLDARPISPLLEVEPGHWAGALLPDGSWNPALLAA